MWYSVVQYVAEKREEERYGGERERRAGAGGKREREKE